MNKRCFGTPHFRRKEFILSFILFFSPALVSAQNTPSIQWQKCLGGSGSDNGNCIIQTRDSGYAIAGSTASNDGNVTGLRGKSDAWIVKLNSLGSLQWQKCLGGTSGDYAKCIIQTSDGGYAIAGATASNDSDVYGNPSGNAAWIVKLDSLGKIRWQRCLEGTKLGPTIIANSIIQQKDGNFVIAGQGILWIEGCFPLSTNAHAFIAKLNPSGDIIWQKCYGGSNFDFANSIIQTYDGGYTFCGSTSSNDGDAAGYHKPADTNYDPYFNNDVWIVKLDSVGIIRWQKCLGGTDNDQGYSVLQSNDSGFLIVGRTKSDDFDVSGLHGDSLKRNDDILAVKLNSSGKLEWQKCLGGSNSEVGLSIIQTSDGGFAIAGITNSNDGDVLGLHSKDTSDIWVLKLSLNGILLWQKCLGGTGVDGGNSIIQSFDGGYTVGGSTGSHDGDAFGNHGKSDVWVVKLSGSSSNVESKNNSFFQSHAPFPIFKIYPNPSSDKVSLQLFDQQTASGVQFYDMMGKQFEPSSSFEGNIATVYVKSLADGVYMTRVTFTYQNYTGSYTLPLVVQH